MAKKKGLDGKACWKGYKQIDHRPKGEYIKLSKFDLL